MNDDLYMHSEEQKGQKGPENQIISKVAHGEQKFF